jgi:hypothetical protein
VFDIEIHQVKAKGKPAEEARAAFEAAKKQASEL